MNKQTKVSNRYFFTQKELKDLLSIEGDIQRMGYWKHQNDGDNTDKKVFCIQTTNINEFIEEDE